MMPEDIVARIDTPALEIQTVSIPANPDPDGYRVSATQLSTALKIWGRGDRRFIPDFVDSTIVEERDAEIIKEVLHYGKSALADGAPNRQRTTMRGDNLMVTEYLAGPWFMAIAGFEEGDDGELRFLLTTVRHKQHPDFVSPADAARRAGTHKAPPTTEQNAQRVLRIIRKLAEQGEVQASAGLPGEET